MTQDPYHPEPTPVVRVASYSNTTWQGSWRQRARAVWGTGFFGMLWGAGLGALIGGALLVFGTGMSFGIIPALALAGAAAGGGIGMVIADSVGAAAGAVGAGMAEWESRFKQMMVEAKLFDKKIVCEEPVSAALNRTEMVDTPEEVNYRGTWFRSAVNWPGLLTFAAVGGTLGLIFATSGLIAIPAGMLAVFTPQLAAATASMAPAAAAALTSTANLAFGGVLGAGFGAVFGVNCPVLTNKMNNSFGKIFSGEAFGKKTSPIITPAPVLEAPAATPPTLREQLVAQRHATLQAHASFAERVDDQRAQTLPHQIH